MHVTPTSHIVARMPGSEHPVYTHSYPPPPPQKWVPRLSDVENGDRRDGGGGWGENTYFLFCNPFFQRRRLKRVRLSVCPSTSARRVHPKSNFNFPPSSAALSPFPTPPPTPAVAGVPRARKPIKTNAIWKIAALLISVPRRCSILKCERKGGARRTVLGTADMRGARRVKVGEKFGRK